MCIAGAGGGKRSVYNWSWRGKEESVLLEGERGVCIAGAGGRKRSVYSWSWRGKEECV